MSRSFILDDEGFEEDRMLLKQQVLPVIANLKPTYYVVYAGSTVSLPTTSRANLQSNSNDVVDAIDKSVKKDN